MNSTEIQQGQGHVNKICYRLRLHVTGFHSMGNTPNLIKIVKTLERFKRAERKRWQFDA